MVYSYPTVGGVPHVWESFIVVVVVVANAMSEPEGELVGMMENYVFRHTERADHNVVTTVNTADLDLDAHSTYTVQIENNGGRAGNDVIATTKVNVTQDGDSFTIPYETVRRSDMIVPGQTVNMKVFEEPDEPLERSDSARVLGRSEVVIDESVRDNCDARLTCRMASDYLADGRKTLRFRNVRTQEEVDVKSHSEYEKKGNAVSFPISAREAVDAQPGDLIEIIRPPEGDKRTEEGDENVEELIREMHSAMMEMYNDYLESQDD